MGSVNNTKTEILKPLLNSMILLFRVEGLQVDGRWKWQKNWSAGKNVKYNYFTIPSLKFVGRWEMKITQKFHYSNNFLIKLFFCYWVKFCSKIENENDTKTEIFKAFVSWIILLFPASVLEIDRRWKWHKNWIF